MQVDSGSDCSKVHQRIERGSVFQLLFHVKHFSLVLILPLITKDTPPSGMYANFLLPKNSLPCTEENLPSIKIIW
jgi:hypothetical protein